jgi:hypothetical protein
MRDAESSNDQLTSVALPGPSNPSFHEIRFAFSSLNFELLNLEQSFELPYRLEQQSSPGG